MEYYTNRYVNVTNLSESNKKYDKDIDSKIHLKPHQLVLLEKCIQREQKSIQDFDSAKYDSLYTDIGIIGDKVGSGKSFVILALIMQDKDPFDNKSISITYGVGSHFIFKQKEMNHVNKKTNLLVISHLLVKQWCQYVEQFCPQLPYCCINTKKALESLEKNIDHYKLVICTGFMYKYVRSLFYTKDWCCTRLFFDEIDTTNTPGANYLPSKFTWFVSASYKNILFPIETFNNYNRSGNTHVISHHGIRNNVFAKTLFMSTLKNMGHNELMVIDKIVVKNEDNFVDESLKLPDIVKIVIICKNPIEINVLTGIVNNDIISSINAGDIHTALSHIHNYNLDSETNIIAKVLFELQTNLSNLKVKKSSIQDLVYTNEIQKNNIITKVSADIEKVETKISEITTRISDNNLCPICYNNVSTKTISKCCSNSFCLCCITKWLLVQNKCPLCKTVSNIKDDYYIVKPDEHQVKKEFDQEAYDKQYAMIPSNDTFTQNLDKFCNLERVLLNRKSYSKFLIFSEFEHGFNKMYPYLEKAGVRFSHLKGSQQTCNTTIKKYKGSELDVLLINSKHYGSGLNLENTTDVILYHKFENQIEKQVIGRAQRTGRKTPLKVWYFFNEIEHSL